jgi:hypothetical protein
VERLGLLVERQKKRGEGSKMEGSDDQVEFHNPTEILNSKMKSKVSLR